jgi:hypothetical protein
MTNKQKTRGTKFENDATDLLNELIDNSEFKRIPSSGAIGTILSEPLLTGDIKGRINAYPKTFKLEAKVGYAHTKEAKSVSVYKEWLDKIALEAAQTYSLPVVISKFEGARKGTKVFVVMDVNVFAEIMNEYSQLKHELDLVYHKLEEKT